MSDAPAQWNHSLYIGQKNKTPAIYEYDRSHNLKSKTSLPLPNGRNHFEVGDYIMVASTPYHMAKHQYKELRIPDPNIDSLWGMFYYLFVVSPPSTIEIGYKITEIKPDEKNPGNGKVKLQPMYLLDADNHLQIGQVETWDSYQQASRLYDVTRNASGANVIGTAYAEGMSNVFGGGGKKMVNMVGRKVAAKTLKASLKRTGKKILIRRIWMALKKDPAKYSINAVKAFVGTLVNELTRHRQLEEQIKKFKTNPTSKAHVEQIIVKPALAKASSAMVLSIISDIIGAQISAALKDVVKSELEKVIVTRLFEFSSIGPIELIINSITDAYAASAKTGKPMQKILDEEMKKKTEDWFNKLVKVDLEKLGAEVVP